MSGRAHKYGDDINTDVIIPARYCNTFVEKELAPHALEDLDKDFVKKVKAGDFIAGGRNFGCGSSRENAPIAIKGAGVAGVIAANFARIFYRNAINIGLPIFESPEASEKIQDGDELEVDASAGLICNLTRKETYRTAAYPEMVQNIIAAGGMINFVKQKLAERAMAK